MFLVIFIFAMKNVLGNVSILCCCECLKALNPLGGAGKRSFRLGANQWQVKSAHFPGLRLAFGDLFHRRANRIQMVAESAGRILINHPVGRVGRV